MKTAMSRFHIHDELTAPESAIPVVRGAIAGGGRLPNFLGVLAGSPAALRAYVRARAELRHGVLAPATVERIALAVAERSGSAAGLALHTRTARRAGLTHDEIALAREIDSRDEHQATLLRYLRPLIEGPAQPPAHLHEEAREAGWTDEELLEAIAQVGLETYTAMVNLAGEIPADAAVEREELRAA